MKKRTRPSRLRTMFGVAALVAVGTVLGGCGTAAPKLGERVETYDEVVAYYRQMDVEPPRLLPIEEVIAIGQREVLADKDGYVITAVTWEIQNDGWGVVARRRKMPISTTMVFVTNEGQVKSFPGE